MKRLFSFFLFLSFCATSCLTDPEAPKNNPDAPTVDYDKESRTLVRVELKGTFPTGHPEIKSYGFDVAEGSFSEEKITTYEVKEADENSFFALASISAGKQFGVKSWYSNGLIKKFSEEKRIDALSTTAAELSEVVLEDGRLVAYVIDSGGRTINELGFAIGETSNQRDIRRGKKIPASIVDDDQKYFSLEISKLTSGKTYYILAYAENSDDPSKDVYGYSRNVLEIKELVAFEDANFGAYLLSHYNTDGNEWISMEEIRAIDDIDVSTDSIYSVKEIAFMPDLLRLAVSGSGSGSGQLTRLDVGCNEKLNTLFCQNNQLDSLDVTVCNSLEFLSFSGNKIAEIDLSKNGALKKLSGRGNRLCTLDLSLNRSLSYVDLRGNPLNTLYLYATQTVDSLLVPQLTRLCYLIDRLSVSPDKLSIPIGGTETLSAIIEPEDAIDKDIEWLSSDENIATVSSDGLITAVGLGTCTIMASAGGKIAVCAVSVNDSYIDINSTSFPDDYFRAYVLANFDRDKDSRLSSSEIKLTTRISVDNLSITSLKGVEFFTALTELVCNSNQLTSLDVSNNTALTGLSCNYNQLTSLDVSQNIALTFLSCTSNQLTSLDVSQNVALTYLECGLNQLTNLDVSQNIALTNLRSFLNQLTSLDVSQNTALTNLECGSNQLTSLDVSQNTDLTNLSCGKNQLTSLDVSQNTALTNLICFSNQLTSLDVRSNTALTKLVCDSNQLTSLDVSQNTVLTYLDCSSNQLRSLKVRQNTSLTYLACSSNRLKSLNVSDNTALESLGCYSNQLTSLDVSNNTALTGLSCGSNQLTSLNLSQNTSLIYLECYSNQLTSLDVSNNTALKSLECYSNRLTSLDVSGCNALMFLICNNNANLIEIWLKTGQVIDVLVYDTEIATIKYK